MLVALEKASAERDALKAELEAKDREDSRVLSALEAEAQALTAKLHPLQEQHAAALSVVKQLEAKHEVALSARLKARLYSKVLLRGGLSLVALIGVMMLPEVVPGPAAFLALVLNVGVIWFMGEALDRAELNDE